MGALKAGSTGTMPLAAQQSLPEYVIKPYQQNLWKDLSEVWRYRGLLGSMIQRQLKIDYGSLHLGIFWVLARPLAMTGMFVLFRHLSSARMGVSIPYTVYLYSGLITWFFFVEAVQGAASALQRDASLVRKVYFPRLISPLSSIGVDLAGLVLAAIPLAILMVSVDAYPGWRLLLLPVIVLQLCMLCLGVGCIFAALNLASEDWQRFLLLALYLGLFVSPVIYAPEMIPSGGRLFYHLNPMSGILVAMRSVLFADFPFAQGAWLYSFGASAVICLAGIIVFNRTQRALMDRL